jgi:hypothetical protein
MLIQNYLCKWNRYGVDAYVPYVSSGCIPNGSS